jgi:hypothetical protein
VVVFPVGVEFVFEDIHTVCGDYRLRQIIPVIDNPGGEKVMAHISFVAIFDELQAMTARLVRVGVCEYWQTKYNY